MSEIVNNPYLSVVVLSRNDDHGGNAGRRMQVSLRGLLEQLEKHRIKSELILVDWNPPDDKPLLKDFLEWPARLRYCTIRIIIVPPTIHRRYKHSEKTPMNTVVAFNCGIRRARGEFILPGAIDLLYSDELMSYIAEKKLKGDERYRIERCDVDRNVVRYYTLKEQLAYCRDNVILIKAYRPRTRRCFWRTGKDLPDLHTSAAGDFQLMSRHYWHLLRGYLEEYIIGAYVDGLFCYLAYAAEVKEVILKEPMRLYHIDHDSKFNDVIKDGRLPLQNWLSFPFLPASMNGVIIRIYRIFLRLIGYRFTSSVSGIPTMHYSEYQRIVQDVVAGKRSYIFNDENWGLGQDTLQEYIINRAQWDKDYEADK